jgi:hypothetical protein
MNQHHLCEITVALSAHIAHKDWLISMPFICMFGWPGRGVVEVDELDGEEIELKTGLLI